MRGVAGPDGPKGPVGVKGDRARRKGMVRKCALSSTMYQKTAGM